MIFTLVIPLSSYGCLRAFIANVHRKVAMSGLNEIERFLYDVSTFEELHAALKVNPTDSDLNPARKLVWSMKLESFYRPAVFQNLVGYGFHTDGYEKINPFDFKSVTTLLKQIIGRGVKNFNRYIYQTQEGHALYRESGNDLVWYYVTHLDGTNSSIMVWLKSETKTVRNAKELEEEQIMTKVAEKLGHPEELRPRDIHHYFALSQGTGKPPRYISLVNGKEVEVEQEREMIDEALEKTTEPVKGVPQLELVTAE